MSRSSTNLRRSSGQLAEAPEMVCGRARARVCAWHATGVHAARRILPRCCPLPARAAGRPRTLRGSSARVFKKRGNDVPRCAVPRARPAWCFATGVRFAQRVSVCRHRGRWCRSRTRACSARSAPACRRSRCVCDPRLCGAGARVPCPVRKGTAGARPERPACKCECVPLSTRGFPRVSLPRNECCVLAASTWTNS